MWVLLCFISLLISSLWLLCVLSTSELVVRVNDSALTVVKLLFVVLDDVSFSDLMILLVFEVASVLTTVVAVVVLVVLVRRNRVASPKSEKLDLHTVNERSKLPSSESSSQITMWLWLLRAGEERTNPGWLRSSSAPSFSGSAR